MTVYTFYGVTFSHANAIYHYLSNDETLSIGDKVIVPVGSNNKDVIAEIVTIEKHRRKTAPYPVDKAKYIKGKYFVDKSKITI